MRKLLTFSVLAICLVTLAGCAKEPVEAIDAARAAIQKAKTAQADVYAQASLSQAESSMKALEAELEAQQKKFALFRKYDVALQTATETAAAAEKAVTDAEATKARMKSEATAMLAETRTLITQLNEMIAAAPQGKDSAADLKMIQADVQGIETTLGQVDAALAEGRFQDALNRAQAANRQVKEIQAEIQAAMQATGKKS
jgi:hypothetical protein